MRTREAAAPSAPAGGMWQTWDTDGVTVTVTVRFCLFKETVSQELKHRADSVAGARDFQEDLTKRSGFINKNFRRAWGQLEMLR